MAFTSAELAVVDVAAARELRITERTDARCLTQMLPWLRGTALMLPVGLFWAYLATRAGAGWWAAAWFAVWLGVQIYIYRLAGRVLLDVTVPARDCLARAVVVFWMAGLVHAALLPVFFVGSDESIKLAITLLALFVAGPVLISSSGMAWAYAGVAVPTASVLVIGWLWHGGVLGYAIAFLCAASLLPAFAAVRQQRRSWRELVSLLDDNEVLAASLKAERDRAETASESKTRFFAAASHDLRQPLHALSINATTLGLVAQRSGDPLLQELSQGIGSALRQSRGLLDGLLDISRLDAHAVQTDCMPHDIGSLLEAVRDEYAGLAAQRGLSLEVNVGATPPWVLTDADQLLRILGNLVDNALKFTRDGGVVLAAHGEAAGRVQVCVSDTGPGIAPADRERVFEEFYQAGNASRDRSQGLGLGLAIVKRTAALLDTPLRLMSEPGRGATFELSLAAAAAASAAPLPAPVNDLDAGKALSVLLVDDEPEVLSSLCTYLRQIGWSARGVANGAEAEQALAQGFPADVLVLDYRLRDETGADVISRLRKSHSNQGGHAHLPVVIVTGDTAAQRLRDLSELAVTVLHKPVDGERLARALVEAVGR